jgi:hypothetical protein
MGRNFPSHNQWLLHIQICIKLFFIQQVWQNEKLFLIQIYKPFYFEKFRMQQILLYH